MIRPVVEIMAYSGNPADSNPPLRQAFLPHKGWHSAYGRLTMHRLRTLKRAGFTHVSVSLAGDHHPRYCDFRIDELL